MGLCISGHSLAPERQATVDFFTYIWGGKATFPPFCYTHLPRRLVFQDIPATFAGQDGQCLLNKFSCFLHYQHFLLFAEIINFLLIFFHNVCVFCRCWLTLLPYPHYPSLQFKKKKKYRGIPPFESTYFTHLTSDSQNLVSQRTSKFVKLVLLCLLNWQTAVYGA